MKKKMDEYYKYEESLRNELNFDINKYMQKDNKFSDYFSVIFFIGLVSIIIFALYCALEYSSDTFILFYLIVGSYLLISFLINKYITADDKKIHEYENRLYNYIIDNFTKEDISKLISKNANKLFDDYNKKGYTYKYKISPIGSHYKTSKLKIEHYFEKHSNGAFYSNEDFYRELNNIFKLDFLKSPMDDFHLPHSYPKELFSSAITLLLLKKDFSKFEYLYFDNYFDDKIEYMYSLYYIKEEIYKYEICGITKEKIKEVIDFIEQHIDNENEQETINRNLYVQNEFSSFYDYIFMLLNISINRDSAILEKIHNVFSYKTTDFNEMTAYYLIINKLILDGIVERYKSRLSDKIKEKKERELRKKREQQNSSTYRNHCWNCYSSINSEVDEKCPKCGWYICSKCGGCSPNNFHDKEHNH